MSELKLARRTRISFSTDMTRGGAIIIPLGVLLEGIWDDARWLGMVGRTKLSPAELQRVNLDTWPDLADPFSFLMKQFESGWNANWGEAGDVLSKAWGRSALRVELADATELLHDARPDFAAAREAASEALLGKLSTFVPALAPVVAAPIVPLRREMPIELVDDWKKAA